MLDRLPPLVILVVPDVCRAPEDILMLPVSAVRDSTVTSSWISTVPPLFRIKLPALLVRVAKVTALSASWISPPSASRIMSPVVSKVVEVALVKLKVALLYV